MHCLHGEDITAAAKQYRVFWIRDAKQGNAMQSMHKQSNEIQCNARQCNAMQCKAMQSKAKQSKAKQRKAKQRNTMPDQAHQRKCQSKANLNQATGSNGFTCFLGPLSSYSCSSRCSRSIGLHIANRAQRYLPKHSQEALLTHNTTNKLCCYKAQR